jgi:signal transduction histidine kinase/CheY-like chemotaxis protein
VQGVDVTARAVADRALALDRARLDYATRLSGVGFWYCDLPFNELQWDERVKDHFFFPPTARITIDDFYARIHEEDRAPTRNAIDASIRERIPYDTVYRTVHPTTGAIKWIRALGGTDYASDGAPTHFDGVTLDVSAQKHDEQRLATLNHQLREQDRRKDEFLATLAHELRNPLAPIRNAAELASRTVPLDSTAYPAIGIVKRQVNQLARLVDDLLDVSRISQGRVDLKMEIVELKNLIDMATETVAPLMREKQHELSIIQTYEPVFVKGDPGRLVQALSNVLTNAAKYTQTHGRIRVRAEERGDTVAVEITDNGAGISADLLPRVFDLFTQSEHTLDRAQGGLGIGLSIVKSLIEMHGGECVARSAGVGQGSTFEITLPRTLPIVEAAPNPLEASRAWRRVLIIDDNVDAATSLAEILRLEGHECEAVFSANAALERVTSLRPDFVLLDIGLPDLDGYEVARRLRQINGLEDVRLIALTGYGQPDDLEQARDAGFDDHFVKPLDFDALERALAQGRSSRRPTRD